jgi:hypothetical protein
MSIFGGPRLALDEFLKKAESYGLPVRFIREVERSYTVVSSESETDDFVRTALNHMYLSTNTQRSIRDISPALPIGEGTAIQTVYHEATHAYFDLKSDDPTFQTISKRVSEHYQEAPLTSGDAADDPIRIGQEAAACYVGHRAAGYWSTLEMLTMLDVKTIQENSASHQYLRNVPGDYNRHMAERTFGYQNTGWLWRRQQTSTTRPIPNFMKDFCDRALLESKIPDGFGQIPRFVEMMRTLCRNAPQIVCPY